MIKRLLIFMVAGILLGSVAGAEDVTVKLFTTTEQGPGRAVGTVSVSDTPYGALFTPQLSGLDPGIHGFHVHANADCGSAMQDGKRVPGLAAGGHYDPSGSGRHEGPYGNGHLGDLPPLVVDTDGTSRLPVLAPRLTTADIRSKSLMIHAGGDNFSDRPAKLGGGGARMACGVVP